MSKLIGKRKQDYLAAIVRQESEIERPIATRLAQRLDAAIRSLRVTKVQLAGLRSEAVRIADAGAPAMPVKRPFDPYAFNAILTLKRNGREALMARLAEIGEISHLRQLAEAQLIGLEQDMRTGSVALEDLREAVLRGVERLVADRRAAAS